MINAELISFPITFNLSGDGSTHFSKCAREHAAEGALDANSNLILILADCLACLWHRLRVNFPHVDQQQGSRNAAWPKRYSRAAAADGDPEEAVTAATLPIHDSLQAMLS